MSDQTQIQPVETTGPVFDAAGPGGTAIRARLTDEHRAQYPATLDLWLLDCPKYHPAWSHYICSLASLRPFPGIPEPVLHYPGAQYELLVYAAKQPAPEVGADYMRWFETHLVPANLVHQFHGLSDELARGVLTKLVRAFVDGTCSPDTDFRSLQVAKLTEWISAARNAS